jgi:hypothetical protein
LTEQLNLTTMGFEWMITLSIKEKKQCSYKTVPLDIIDQLFKKKNDRDLDPPVRWRHQSKGLVERPFDRCTACENPATFKQVVVLPLLLVTLRGEGKMTPS